MGQTCSICQHVQADEIAAAIGRGETGRAIAREFGVSEAALRRHLANHRPQGSDEAAPGAPERPADAPEDLDPASVARRRYEAEEEERRGQRLAALEAEERDRRDRERASSDRAAASEALRKEADEMAVRRGDLEDEAQDLIISLKRKLDELADLDREHLRVRSRAGILGASERPVGNRVRPWVSRELGPHSPDGGTLPAIDPYGGRPLRERDPLTPDAREIGEPPDAA